MKKVREEDPEQSRRFMEAARELEDAGDLDLDEAERRLDKLTREARKPMVPRRTKPQNH